MCLVSINRVQPCPYPSDVLCPPIRWLTDNRRSPLLRTRALKAWSAVKPISISRAMFLSWAVWEDSSQLKIRTRVESWFLYFIHWPFLYMNTIYIVHLLANALTILFAFSVNLRCKRLLWTHQPFTIKNQNLIFCESQFWNYENIKKVADPAWSTVWFAIDWIQSYCGCGVQLAVCVFCSASSYSCWIKELLNRPHCSLIKSAKTLQHR